MLGEMERNRQEHESRVEREKVEAGALPWTGVPNEALAMKQMLALSLVSYFIFISYFSTRVDAF